MALNFSKSVFRSRHLLLGAHKKLLSNVSFDLEGIFPAIVTPFDSNEEIDFGALRSNVAKWADMPFRGFVVQGSNGEYVNMTIEERVEIVQEMRAVIPPTSGKLLLAGSGCQSTRVTIALTQRMADVGADAALVVTPSFYKGRLTNEALQYHYAKVADASKIPIIMYSVPANTGVDLDQDVIIHLASHPNIIGLKDSGGDIAKLGYIVHKTRNLNFQVLAGSAGFLLPALTVGCIGGIFALGNVLGDHVCELHQLFNSGQHKNARALQHRLVGPNSAVTKKYGIAGLKQSMEWFGFYGGYPRKPLMPLSDADRETLRSMFVDNGFL